MSVEHATNASRQPALRFSLNERRELEHIGLTEPQMLWMERELPLIKNDITGPLPMRMVRRELMSLDKTLLTLDKTLDSWAAASGHLIRSSGAEALGHMSLAATLLDCRHSLSGVDDLDGAVPQRIDVRVLVKLARAVCEAAIESEAPNRQRPRWSKRGAIERIHKAINRPIDEASKSAAAAFVPSRASGGPFVRLCEIVFARAVGNVVGIESAIRDHLRQQAGV